MKCIKLTSSNKVLRVNDEYADYLVQQQIAVFTNKARWKQDGRNYLTKMDEQLLKGVRNESGSKEIS